MKKRLSTLIISVLAITISLLPHSASAQQTNRSQRIFGHTQDNGRPTTDQQAKPSQGQGIRMYGDMLTLRNPRPGGLRGLITPDIKKRVRRLIIEGAINKEDAYVLRDIANRSSCTDDRGKSIDNYLDLDLMRSSLESSYSSQRDVTYDDMFANTYHLRSVRLPMRVKGLGRRTFYNCKQLDLIEMPSGIRYFGDGAFKDCPNLERINLPSELEEIGAECFKGCKNLSAIVIPHTVAVIGNEAFANCPITQLQLPEGLQSLGKWCITGTRLKSIHIPSGTHIEGNATGNSLYLEAITVDERNKEYSSLDGVLFDHAQSVLLQMPVGRQGTYTIPASVDRINAYSFQNSQLGTIIIPSAVRTIGEGAFYNCKRLQSMVLPQTVTAISGKTFQGCSSLQSIQIPDQVISIGNSAFTGCEKLSSLTLPTQLKILGKEAFRSCHSLTNIQVPEGITTLPSQCFIDCIGLVSITLPSHLQSIEEEAFKGCASLSSLRLPNSLVSIGSEVFRSCNSLQEIIIPASVQAIGKKPFIKCEQLQRIVCLSATPPELKSNGSEKVMLVVPAGSASAYKKASQWKKYKTIVER